MKTIYAPETETALEVLQAFAQANVGVVFIVAILAAAAFASWASKHI